MDVNAQTERLQLVKILGKYALFADRRIDQKTIPAGLYCYDLRGSEDDPDRSATLERGVDVDHAGSVLLFEPIIFIPAMRCIDIRGKLKFLHKEMTVDEFRSWHDRQDHNLTEYMMKPASVDGAGFLYMIYQRKERNDVSMNTNAMTGTSEGTGDEYGRDAKWLLNIPESNSKRN